jgi:hypothetical protein
MADDYLYGLHPYLRNDVRAQKLGGRGPHNVPGGIDPRGLGSEASPSMPNFGALGQPLGTSMSTQAADRLDRFGQAVKRRYAKIAYSEQTRFNPGTTIHHLAEEPKLRSTGGPARRMNQDMMRASMMQSSATTRSVASVDNQVKKIVAEKEALNAQRRRIQIAGDLEREAMSLEQSAIKAANKGVEVVENLVDSIPNIQVAVEPGRTMNTALVLGAIALGVIAATMFARR